MLSINNRLSLLEERVQQCKKFVLYTRYKYNINMVPVYTCYTWNIICCARATHIRSICNTYTYISLSLCTTGASHFGRTPHPMNTIARSVSGCVLWSNRSANSFNFDVYVYVPQAQLWLCLLFILAAVIVIYCMTDGGFRDRMLTFIR